MELDLGTTIHLVQTGMLFALAAQLSLGVRDNLFNPSLNLTFTTQVLRLERLEAEYPDLYKLVKHRRVDNPRLHRAAFIFIVLAEAVVSIILWVGTVLMALALFGEADPETARAVAILGAFGFSAIYAGFSIAGEHFVYWMCHYYGQFTHLFFILWGLGVLILLVAA